MNIEKVKQIKDDAKIALSSIIGIVFLIFITNPSQMPIIFVLLIPMLIALFSFVGSRLFLRVFFDLSDYQLKVCSYALSGGVLFILLLGSLKQLGFQDFVLVLLLTSGLAFYFLRSSQVSGT